MKHIIKSANAEAHNNRIISGKAMLQHSKNGESLTYDTLDADLFWGDIEPCQLYTAEDFPFFASDGAAFYVNNDVPAPIGDTNFAKSGAEIDYIQDGKLVKRFYQSEIKEIGKGRYKLSAVSVIGILEGQEHYGGIYTGQLLSAVLSEIFEGFKFSVSQSVASIRLYGYLPIGNKRENLLQITIATNIAIKQDAEGNVLIDTLANDNRGTIPRNRTAIGGNANNTGGFTKVKVYEHQFIAGNDEVVAFSGVLNGNNTVRFSEPLHSLSITGGTIISSNANHAIISGNGNVELKGKKYTHTTKEVSHGASEKKVYLLKDATLVTSLNSTSVAKRLYDVYSCSTTISESIKQETEECGQVWTVQHPYDGTEAEAYIEKTETTFGSYNKAVITALVGFKPSGGPSGYSRSVLLTSGTSWTVPADCKELRPIIIAGGTGGTGGTGGNSGNGSDDWRYEKPCIGGAGGAGGAGGKVYDVGTISVTPGQTFATTFGEGGTGGAGGQAGSQGTATTFGDYSSDSGVIVEFVDIFTGNAYASQGPQGIPGNDGYSDKTSRFEPIEYEGQTYTNGKKGQDGGYPNSGGWQGYGGLGGGAAVGANGGDGGDGDHPRGGSGGSGATATIPGKDATIFGAGGQGGHGGGGGGMPGSSTDNNPGYDSSGGGGSNGGAGAPGCIIIYY